MSDDPQLSEATTKSALTLSLAVPFFLAAVLLILSPNFQTQKGPRNEPLAGDFVQDWVGGHVVSTEPKKLYDSEFVQTVQHDASLLGFHWPEEKYFPMVYPPFFYAAMVPFAKLDYFVAAKIWIVLSGLACSLAGYLLIRFNPKSKNVVAMGLWACLIFTPLIKCLSMSHKSTLLLLILTATFLLLENRKFFLSGLVFGLIAFKPHLGILIGLAMLLKGNWKFASGALATVGILVAGSWVWEPSWWPGYLKTMSDLSSNYVQSGGYQLAESHSLWGASQLSFGGLGSQVSKWIAIGGAVGVCVLLWQCLRGDIRPGTSRFPQQFSALVLGTILLSPHFYTYDLTILLLPMVLLTSAFEENWHKSNLNRAIAIILGLLFCLSGSFPRIAETIRFQPSLILIVGLLFLIAKGQGTAEQRETS